MELNEVEIDRKWLWTKKKILVSFGANATLVSIRAYAYSLVAQFSCACAQEENENDNEKTEKEEQTQEVQRRGKNEWNIWVLSKYVASIARI